MAAKRFQTYFTVPLPPWKDRKLGAGSITIRFVIKGTVPSKKNNQQAVCIRKEANKFIHNIKGPITKEHALQAIKLVRGKMRGNDKYKQFLKEQRPIIEEQRKFWIDRLQAKGLTFPLSAATMSIRFYFAQRYRQDSINKQQSIQDLLKDCHIIHDDDYTCINPIVADADCFHGEITQNLTFVSLSFKL